MAALPPSLPPIMIRHGAILAGGGMEPWRDQKWTVAASVTSREGGLTTLRLILPEECHNPDVKRSVAENIDMEAYFHGPPTREQEKYNGKFEGKQEEEDTHE